MKYLSLCSLVVSLLVSMLSFAFTPLDDKLQHQWLHYQAAQNELLTKIQSTHTDQLISRSEWEKMLELDGADAWTPEDIALLKADQNNRIQTARKIFLAESTIDLQKMRNLPTSEAKVHIAQFCLQVPKGGMLHIHPWGTFSRQTVQELMAQNNPDLAIKEILTGLSNPLSGAYIYQQEAQWLSGLGDTVSYQGLSSINQNSFRDFLFLPPGKQSFPRFNAVFDFLGSAIVTWADYEKAILDFAIRATREGVIYAEFSSGANPEEIAILKKVEKQTGLIVRINKSFARSNSTEKLQAQALQLLQQESNPWLVGIDFLDNEEGNPALEKGQLLYGSVLNAVRAGKSQLHRTMHAGELGDVRNPRDAMILGAERLGHGVNLNEDPIALEYASQHHIAVEVNLVSNLRLTKIQSIKEHPFLNYLRLGIPISLSTDDEGIFDTDIQHDCEVAVAESDISYAELKQMAFNSIETAFASKSDKLMLNNKLIKAFVDFEGKAQSK